MSRIIDIGVKDTSLPFGIYIPSGMMQNGSLIVSWATGVKATSQIDWGFTEDMPHSTPVENGDKRWHKVAYPLVKIGQRHFFLVRSTHEHKTLQGKLQSVFICGNFVIEKRVPLTSSIDRILVDAVPPDIFNPQTIYFTKINPDLSLDIPKITEETTTITVPQSTVSPMKDIGAEPTTKITPDLSAQAQVRHSSPDMLTIEASGAVSHNEFDTSFTTTLTDIPQQ
jgi:hypothetical protein